MKWRRPGRHHPDNGVELRRRDLPRAIASMEARDRGAGKNSKRNKNSAGPRICRRRASSAREARICVARVRVALLRPQRGQPGGCSRGYLNKHLGSVTLTGLSPRRDRSPDRRVPAVVRVLLPDPVVRAGRFAGPGRTLLRRLEVQTWGSLLGSSNTAPTRGKHLRWVNVIDGWIGATWPRLGAARMRRSSNADGGEPGGRSRARG